MKAFKGSLYVSTGIQNGGHDLTNNIGPAASEVLRINPDDSWDLIVGTTRDTPEGKRTPLSALPPGFGNPFNGYFWSMEVHDGWLYVGTMDAAIWTRYMKLETYPKALRHIVSSVGIEKILEQHAGCDIWRTADGENWLPITRTGFDNEYNYGVRNMVSTPHGLFVAMANPFGPEVAVRDGDGWKYEYNPRGGCEIWHGSRDPDEVTPLDKVEERSPWVRGDLR